MKKRILHIIVKSQYDGVTSYSIRLIKNLPQYDHQILSCYKGEAIEEIKGMNISYEHLLNMGSISIKYLLLKYYKIISYLKKNNFDIIHYHQGGIGVLLLAWLFKKKAKIIHHIHAANLIGDHSKYEISGLHTRLLKFLSSRTVMIAVAEHILSNYRCTIIDDNSSVLISNSVPFHFAKKEKIEHRIGYIGRINVRKGFGELINISAIYKKKSNMIKFIAQGDFDEDLSDTVDYSNIELSNVTFQIDEFFEKIDLLFFLSSSQEGLPLVVLEAIAFDVGVIAYPLKGVVEILGDDYPLYVSNPVDAISKIDYFYSDKFDRQKLSDIHKERSNMFNFDEMIRQINMLYKSN